MLVSYLLYVAACHVCKVNKGACEEKKEWILNAYMFYVN